MKLFNTDFDKFLTKLKNHEPFSISRWGDGELMILENKHIDLRHMKNGEFCYNPTESKYQPFREKLMKSYTYHSDNYYIGIACKCCVVSYIDICYHQHNIYKQYQCSNCLNGMYMKQLSTQDEEHLTWANIFVNSNYKLFMEHFVPEMNNHKVVMIVNNQAKPEQLPFDVLDTYYVGTDAWYEDYKIIDEIKEKYNNSNDITFLIAAGPLANILTYELWIWNNKNSYIDIGSTLDVKMGMRPTRGYLNGASTLNKTCVW